MAKLPSEILAKKKQKENKEDSKTSGKKDTNPKKNGLLDFIARNKKA